MRMNKMGLILAALCACVCLDASAARAKAGDKGQFVNGVIVSVEAIANAEEGKPDTKIVVSNKQGSEIEFTLTKALLKELKKGDNVRAELVKNKGKGFSKEIKAIEKHKTLKLEVPEKKAETE